jgi:hypothetical protein
MRHRLSIAAVLVISIGLLGVASTALEEAGVQTAEAPKFKADPLWPKLLPNHWLLGSGIGVGVDSRDHVFVIHRRDSFNERTEIGAATDPPTGSCCVPAPNILEFDPEGSLVNSRGGPAEGYDWPTSHHGLSIDHEDNIWIGGNGDQDSHIRTYEGKRVQKFVYTGMGPVTGQDQGVVWPGRSGS